MEAKEFKRMEEHKVHKHGIGAQNMSVPELVWFHGIIVGYSFWSESFLNKTRLLD